METFLIATALVALAEMGDKTQLLTLVLAARYRRPWPLLAGIVIATLANHLLAAWLGRVAGSLVPAGWLEIGLGVAFILVGLWLLVPDKEDEESDVTHGFKSVLVITTVAFFLAEMGDKTQVATVMLGARFDSLAAVVAGTTAGMVAANAPVAWLGHRYADRLPLRWIRPASAALFAALGAWTLVSALA